MPNVSATTLSSLECECPLILNCLRKPQHIDPANLSMTVPDSRPTQGPNASIMALVIFNKNRAWQLGAQYSTCARLAPALGPACAHRARRAHGNNAVTNYVPELCYRAVLLRCFAKAVPRTSTRTMENDHVTELGCITCAHTCAPLPRGLRRHSAAQVPREAVLPPLARVLRQPCAPLARPACQCMFHRRPPK